MSQNYLIHYSIHIALIVKFIYMLISHIVYFCDFAIYTFYIILMFLSNIYFFSPQKPNLITAVKYL